MVYTQNYQEYFHASESEITIPLFHQTTPLHVAATKGNLDAVRYLVDSGADFNIEQQYGVSEQVYQHLWIVLSHAAEQKFLP